MQKKLIVLLTEESRAFLDALHRQFNGRRLQLLKDRESLQKELDAGWNPGFPKDDRIRKDLSWQAAPIPPDVLQRWVEITGPVERKMMINALNSGADIFMADFEDSLSPTWENVLQGQINLIDAVQRQISFTSTEGKQYRLNEKIATLFVRPRGWHLNESHYQVDGEVISASLFDFGLYFFHNVKALLERGTGPYFYLPKLENSREAALWNDVFAFAEMYFSISRPVIKVTVLIETILAAFEMEEILFELKNYCIGLNAGRWDYIFSIIKKFSSRKGMNFPDRGQIQMTVPFMKAYTELLIHTCHKRGAFAMGGMSAFVPNRKDPFINDAALAQVKSDKLRETDEGFDGTWVAHPDLVPLAHGVFKDHMQGKPHQIEKKIPERIKASELLNFAIPNGKITQAGVLQNISVALLYLESWLKGVGAVTLNNLMEDAATAEISRAQLWQWAHHDSPFTLAMIKELIKQEYDRDPQGLKMPFVILNKLVEQKNFINFLTLEAYPYLNYEK